MPEINLLPDDLRDKERKELDSAKRKPKIVKVEMSSPQKDVTSQPLKVAKPSLVTRMFSRKTKKAAPLPPEPEEVPEKIEISDTPRAEKRVFNIPKIKIGNSKGQEALTDLPSIPGPGEVSQKISDLGNPKDGPTYDKYAAEANKAKFINEMKREPQSSVRTEKTAKPKKKKKGFSLFGGFSKKKKKSDDSKSILEQAVNDDQVDTPEKPENPKRKEKEEKKKDNESQPDESGKKDKGGKPVLELNLIPEELSRYPELELPRRLFTSGVLIFIFTLLIIGAYLGITWYQINITNQIQEQENLVEETNAAIVNEEGKKLKSEDLQERLQVIEELLNNHIYWTEFFALLEENTLPNVYYTNFAMSGTDSIVLSAVAPDYSTIAKQIVVFEEAKHFVRTVSVNSAAASLSFNDSSVIEAKFNIDLKFQSGIFLKNN